MRTLTVKQIKTIASTCKYLLLTQTNGEILGVNCKVMELGNNKKHSDDEKTIYTGWSKANINEYISHKSPFI